MDNRDILDYIKNQFGVEGSQGFPYSWQKNHSNLISIKNAKPLEQQRAEVTVNSLIEWGTKTKELIEKYDYRFVMNWDESSREDKSNTEKAVYVSYNESQKNVYYKTKNPSGHTTYLWSIFGDGEKLPPLIIISQKTVDDDLKQFGMVEGPYAYIAST